jgi:hypothetical protein
MRPSTAHRIAGMAFILLATQCGAVSGQDVPSAPPAPVPAAPATPAPASDVTAAPTAAHPFAHLAPALLKRAEWKAKPPLPGLKPHTPASIVVHHTSVAQNPRISLERKLQNLQSFSQQSAPVGSRMKPPWPDIPYHFYIDLAGRIGEARDPAYMGDSNTRYDLAGHIQVVLEGDFEKEKPGKAQLEALAALLLWLSVRWDIPPERISTHKDRAPTTCPGRHLLSELPQVLGGVREQRTAQIAKLCAADPAADIAARYCAPR